jgi:hypothetical protein
MSCPAEMNQSIPPTASFTHRSDLSQSLSTVKSYWDCEGSLKFLFLNYILALEGLWWGHKE